MFKRILVCLDGSKLSEQILPYATEEALHFNSRVTLLQVVTVSTMIAAAGAHRAPAQTSNLIEETLHRTLREAKAYLERIAEPLSKQGISVECVAIERSPVGNAIVSYARDNSIDLISIATHGHSGLGRVVFGSIADHVLKKSGLPILLIKPEEEEIEIE